MTEIRRQLTLFIPEKEEAIEKVRAEFNPMQHNLIAAHVTLCREDEIESVEEIIKNIGFINLNKPILIQFNPIERFANCKGVLIPAKGKNKEFRKLRKLVLGLNKFPREHQPHITLMHPRNSTCNDEIFQQIKNIELPTELYFDTICLIEQKNGGKWTVLEKFLITKKAD